MSSAVRQVTKSVDALTRLEGDGDVGGLVELLAESGGPQARRAEDEDVDDEGVRVLTVPDVSIQRFCAYVDPAALPFGS